jgi:hypothetical protein
MTQVQFFLAALTLVMCSARTSAQDATPSEQPQLPAGGTPVGANPFGGSSFGAGGGFGISGRGGANPFGAEMDRAAPEARFVASGAIIITWSENKDAAWGFSKTTGKWTRQELKPPAMEPPTVGDRLGVIQAGSTVYAYSGQTGRWDVLSLPADHHPQVGVHEEFVLVNDGSDIYTFADAIGRWTSPDGKNVNEAAESNDEVRVYPLLGPRRAPYADALTVEPTSVEDLRRKSQEFDQAAAKLAEQYREQSATRGPNHPELVGLKVQLAAAVKQAFQTRQQLHQVELAEFQRRIQDIQRTIEARQQIQDEIIERRVSELLNPQLQWEAAAPPRAAGGGIPSGQVGRRSAGRGPVASAAAIDPPKAEDTRRPQRELGEMPEQRVRVGVVSDATDPERIVVSSAEIGGIRAGEELLVTRSDQFTPGEQLVGWMEIVQAGDETAIGRVLVTRRVLANNRYQAATLQPGDNVARVLKPPTPFDPPLGMREASANNLKQLMLAMHNYYDANKRFPPAVILGKDGRAGPPHSWRVELLPFLEQQDLYDEYRFDEPWDSEHNRALLSKMPAVFRSPLDEPDSTNASYFALVTPGLAPEVGAGAPIFLEGSKDLVTPGLATDVPGDESGFGEDAGGLSPEGLFAGEAAQPSWRLGTLFSRPDGTRMHEVTDGTSNTIALVEAKQNIPWTRPHDIAYVADQALPMLGGWFPEGWHAGFADGSVRFLPADTDETALRALVTIGGGENVRPQLLEPKPAEKQ